MKICLDAGHYGKYNRSPVVPKYYESEMNWKLHLKLKSELEKYGVSVVTTRSDQEKDLGLIERGKLSKDCELFLSLHSNAAGREDADHVVIFRLLDDAGTDIDDTAKTLADKLAHVITEVMGVKEKNFRIAANKASTDRNGDGKLNDNYYGVLHGARTVGTPALIIEHSFHTNERSTNWLLVEANLDKLAKAEAEVIANYFGLKKTIYRVQVGAYTVKANAEKMQSKLKAAGYNGFITKVGQYHKVQIGAFEVKANADRLAAELKKKGFSTYIAKVTI